MRKLHFAKTLCGVLAGTAVLSACVDDKYDLGNLNTTVQIGQGQKITLPTSSSTDITMKSIFDIDEGSAVEEHADGSYFVNTEGNADPTTINVDVINIRKPKDQSFNATLDLRDQTAGVKANAPRRASSPFSGYYYDISELAHASIEGAEATGISTDVKSIEKITFNPTAFKLTVDVSGKNISIIKMMHFEKLVLHMPKGLTVSSCSFMGKELLEGNAELVESIRTTGVLDISGRMAALSHSTDFEGYKNGDPVQFTLNIVSSDVAAGETTDGVGFDANAHKAKMAGEILLEGYVSITEDDVDVDLLTTLIKEKAAKMDPMEAMQILNDIASGNYQTALSEVLPSIDFIGKGAFGSDLAVTKFSGKIQHSINSINPIELNNLPDFLTDDGVNLDLANPQIYLKLAIKSNNSNQFNQKISTSVQLDAYQNGISAPTGTANTGTLIFDMSDPTKYTAGADGNVMLTRIFSNPEGVVNMPEEFESLASKMQQQRVADLSSLLTKVPNRVEVKGGNNSKNIEVYVECNDVSLPQNTTINFEYKVYTPLTFGEKFKIVYTDSEDGWADDMEDLEDLNFESIEIEATATSNSPVPMDMDITVKPIAVDGSEITQLIVDKVKIPAATGKLNHKFKLTMKPDSKHIMRDFFRGTNGVKKLDGIKYVATMDNATKDETLKTTQYIKLENVKITLVGGITYFDED